MLFVLEFFLVKVGLYICKMWLILSFQKNRIHVAVAVPPYKHSLIVCVCVCVCVCVFVCVCVSLGVSVGVLLIKETWFLFYHGFNENILQPNCLQHWS